MLDKDVLEKFFIWTLRAVLPYWSSLAAMTMDKLKDIVPIGMENEVEALITWFQEIAISYEEKELKNNLKKPVEDLVQEEDIIFLELSKDQLKVLKKFIMQLIALLKQQDLFSLFTTGTTGISSMIAATQTNHAGALDKSNLLVELESSMNSTDYQNEIKNKLSTIFLKTENRQVSLEQELTPTPTHYLKWEYYNLNDVPKSEMFKQTMWRYATIRAKLLIDEKKPEQKDLGVMLQYLTTNSTQLAKKSRTLEQVEQESDFQHMKKRAKK